VISNDLRKVIYTLKLSLNSAQKAVEQENINRIQEVVNEGNLVLQDGVNLIEKLESFTTNLESSTVDYFKVDEIIFELQVLCNELTGGKLDFDISNQVISPVKCNKKLLSNVLRNICIQFLSITKDVSQSTMTFHSTVENNDNVLLKLQYPSDITFKENLEKNLAHYMNKRLIAEQGGKINLNYHDQKTEILISVPFVS
jgi:hypothetical protein